MAGSYFSGIFGKSPVKPLQQHMEKVVSCVSELIPFTRAVLAKDVEACTLHQQNIVTMENEADILRREILVNISKSELTTQMREDLSHVVKRIDRIANTSDGAARRLSGMNSDDFYSLGDDILAKIMEMVQLSVEITKILYNLIKKLPEMLDREAFKICENIQAMEHKVDVLHSTVYEMLNKKSGLGFNAFVAIQICNFVDLVETISDKVEDVGDYIEILKTAKRNT